METMMRLKLSKPLNITETTRHPHGLIPPPHVATALNIPGDKPYPFTRAFHYTTTREPVAFDCTWIKHHSNAENLHDLLNEVSYAEPIRLDETLQAIAFDSIWDLDGFTHCFPTVESFEPLLEHRNILTTANRVIAVRSRITTSAYSIERSYKSP
jgi:hypothetical protein